MRYLKYQNTNKNIKMALKEQYKTLTKDERRTVRKEKRWRIFSTFVSFIVFVLMMSAGFVLIVSIPLHSDWLLSFLAIVLIIICGFSTYILTLPLRKKVGSFCLPQMKQEIFSKACSHLRDYYELQEPYIITKCFDSSDKKFRNHDLCIFVARDELRITADLKRGFLHGERDLGCYAFNRDEITLSEQQNGKHLIAELNANNTVFLLGYKAKGFIEKNFVEKESK